MRKAMNDEGAIPHGDHVSACPLWARFWIRQMLLAIKLVLIRSEGMFHFQSRNTAGHQMQHVTHGVSPMAICL